MLFISNVPLSTVPGQGPDAVGEVLGEFAANLPLKAHGVWHYDHVCRLLDRPPASAPPAPGRSRPAMC